MRPRSDFAPALEGLRGLAVAGVLLFHGGFAWASGGFLGVSTFFTLSGFLITRLLLGEWTETDAIDLGRFWERRIRRLLPALLLTVAGVALFGPVFAEPSQLWSLPGDALGSLGFVVNWRFTAAGERYADLFEQPSLLLHCWSLGVEGQFYLFAPLLVRAVLRRARQRLRAVGSLLGGLALASLTTTVALALSGSTPDRIYYGTDTRMLEIVVGGALALWLRRRSDSAPPWASTAGTVALAALLWLWSSTTTTSHWLGVGGLGGHATLSALVVLAGLAERGPVRRLLITRPLRWLGRVSYGAYLYHWPLFLALTPARVGLEGWSLFGLRVVATLILAELSARFVELPVRRGRGIGAYRALRTAWATLAILACVSIAMQARAPAPVDPFAEAARELEARDRVTDAGDAIAYAIFGDSMAYGVEHALDAWTARHPGRLVRRRGEITAGCGLTGSGVRAHWPDERGCEDWPTRWAARIGGQQVALAIVHSVRWEIVEQRIPGVASFTGPGRPDFDTFLLARMNEAVDVLAADGAIVVWLLSPPIEPGRRLDLPAFSDAGPERVRRYNELVQDVARRRREVALVDVASYVASLSLSERIALRPDGIHIPRSAAPTFGDWLGPAILAAYARASPAAQD